MLDAPARSIFDVITDFLATQPTAEDILLYRLPLDLQSRADELVGRNGEGQLTFEDQRELFDFIRADQMIALLKTKTELRSRNLYL